MLLRRITEHVTAQNWTAVALDFAIVVTGVFIGLQVSNWNDARGDLNEEQRYYEQLLVDLALDVETAEIAIKVAKRNDDAADLVFEAVTDEEFEIGDPTMLAVSFEMASYGFIPLTKSDTFDELKSTGSFRLLRNKTLKREIIDYYGDLSDSRQWDASLRQVQQNYSFAAAGLLDRDQLRSMWDTSIHVSEDEARRIIEQAKLRPSLINHLAPLASVQDRLRNDSIIMRDRANALSDSIKAEIQ